MYSVSGWTALFRSLDPSVGVVLVAVGLALVIHGYRLYRVVASLTYAAIAFGATWTMAGAHEWRLPMAVGAGLVAGGMAWLLYRYAVAALAGGAGMAITTAVANTLGCSHELAILFGAGGFVVLAAMAFVNWMELVAFVTSLEGALLLVTGVMSLMTLKPALFSYFYGMMAHNSLFLPFAVFFPAATGFFLQLAALQRKDVATDR